MSQKRGNFELSPVGTEGGNVKGTYFQTLANVNRNFERLPLRIFATAERGEMRK
jgi:hypothetical protein